MELLRKQITDFCAEIINQIDIQTEKVLQNNHENKVECEKLRETLIQKIKEFQTSSLNDLTSDSKLAFEKKICFFIPNLNFEVAKDDDNIYEGYDGTYMFKFYNYTGHLFLFNIFLNKDIITYINQTLNNMYDDEFPNLESYKDKIKCEILLNLLNSKALQIKQSPIIDLTNQIKNVIEELKLADNEKDLELKDLEFLPKIVNFELLNKVSISTNRLEFIRLDILNFFKNLNHLTIEFTEPIEISKHLFNGLDKLKNLKITGLTGIKNEAFTGLNNLECLDLSTNELLDLEATTFDNLNKLETLFLNTNKLTNIRKETFKNLKTLKKLDISENELDSLEEKSFDGLENLQHLSLCYQDYQMSYKELKIHQTSLESCQKLEILNLSFYQVVNPDSLKCLKNLKYLNLYSNFLAEVSFLNYFETLEVLNLNENMLELKDLESIKLPNLKFLTMNCKKISKFGEGFKNLQALDFSRVSALEANSFENFEKLEYIKIAPSKWPIYDENIKFNKLENLKIIRFNTITKVKTFDIDLNKIGKSFFANQPNVELKFANSNRVYTDDEYEKDFSKFLNVSPLVKNEIKYYF